MILEVRPVRSKVGRGGRADLGRGHRSASEVQVLLVLDLGEHFVQLVKSFSKLCVHICVLSYQHRL